MSFILGRLLHPNTFPHWTSKGSYLFSGGPGIPGCTTAPRVGPGIVAAATGAAQGDSWENCMGFVRKPLQTFLQDILILSRWHFSVGKNVPLKKEKFKIMISTVNTNSSWAPNSCLPCTSTRCWWVLPVNIVQIIFTEVMWMHQNLFRRALLQSSTSWVRGSVI